ncbi:MAG: hypothetical protein VW339_11880 [Quisquiliibacterium sp.]
MALSGEAFLAIWHDIDPPMQEEYTEWHTREHMPERLSVPGFVLGKRLVREDAPRYRYGTIYAGNNIEVFRSPAYLERLNNPTAWTNQLQPAFRNFLRMACQRIASAGLGDGGAIATIRINFIDKAGEPQLRAGAQRLAEVLLRIRGACAAHVGLARREISSTKTRETELRPGMQEPEFDALVLLEGSELSQLDQALPEIDLMIAASGCGIGNPQTVVYRLAYQLAGLDAPAPLQTS